MFSALILGIVQGLTEFLPVSSSGHLVIFTNLFPSFPNLDQQLFFDIMLHLGTLAAVGIVFRKKIVEILLMRDLKYALMVFACLVPTGIIGVLFKHPLENMFGSPRLVCLMLIVTGLLLAATRFKKNNGKDLTMTRAFIIGVVQGIAIIPGISRSGSTIAVGLFLGLKREQAAAFSFILSIPSILGAVVLHGKDLAEGPGLPAGSALPVALGTVSAFAIGIVALKVLLSFVNSGRLHLFAPYCILAGIAGIIYF
ncbi:MAG: hypothetical protein A2487_10490 [Candidatus Raymondbacteria bacterium RifOxyC12_full_50_8]|nr:MAG: hypothetical protein A2487_10490 [Candidatus Raymondbacteria bacterium RifOxyC12_full_50_8]